MVGIYRTCIEGYNDGNEDNGRTRVRAYLLSLAASKLRDLF